MSCRSRLRIATHCKLELLNSTLSKRKRRLRRCHPKRLPTRSSTQPSHYEGSSYPRAPYFDHHSEISPDEAPSDIIYISYDKSQYLNRYGYM